MVIDRETDGRWIASVPKLPGVHVYGASKSEALRRALKLAIAVLSEGK